MGQQILVTFIGLRGISHTGILTHRPQASTVHIRLNPASKGILAGISDFGFMIVGVHVAWRVRGMDGDVGGSFRIAWVAVGFRLITHQAKLFMKKKQNQTCAECKVVSLFSILSRTRLRRTKRTSV